MWHMSVQTLICDFPFFNNHYSRFEPVLFFQSHNLVRKELASRTCELAPPRFNQLEPSVEIGTSILSRATQIPSLII